jgi:hypothetical protein
MPDSIRRAPEQLAELPVCVANTQNRKAIRSREAAELFSWDELIDSWFFLSFPRYG